MASTSAKKVSAPPKMCTFKVTSTPKVAGVKNSQPSQNIRDEQKTENVQPCITPSSAALEESARTLVERRDLISDKVLIEEVYRRKAMGPDSKCYM